MNDGENDPVLSRAIAELRRLPAADPAAVRQVVRAAAAARVSTADEPLDERVGHGGRSLRLWSAASIAAAAIIGFAARGVLSPPASSSSAAPARTGAVAAGATPLVAASAVPGVAVPLAQQFVIENPTARRVSVVGDFNRWDAASAPMTRSPNGGLWSVVIPVLPGRHVYGFMIDDSLFTLDPRPGVPKARDPDLGTEASVVMVGRP